MLDGGDVVHWRDKIILTEKIFTENPKWGRARLISELAGLLVVNRLILIPQEPGDVTGHADGVARFVNGGSVVVNDYRRVDRKYRRQLLRRLHAVGLTVHEIPYQPSAESSQGMPSAVGNYVNFVQVGTALIMPSCGLAEDGEAREQLTTMYPDCSVTSLDCRELAELGIDLNGAIGEIRESLP